MLFLELILPTSVNWIRCLKATSFCIYNLLLLWPHAANRQTGRENGCIKKPSVTEKRKSNKIWDQFVKRFGPEFFERRCCQKRRGSSIYLHCTWAKNTQSIVSFQTLQRDFVLLGEDRKKKNLHANKGTFQSFYI